ncbi:MAG TPA: hypothetical protein VMT03_09670 [Polyangia bacterium]|nr:hypothetical protein [Polyangia bacterium]
MRGVGASGRQIDADRTTELLVELDFIEELANQHVSGSVRKGPATLGTVRRHEGILAEGPGALAPLIRGELERQVEGDELAHAVRELGIRCRRGWRGLLLS